MSANALKSSSINTFFPRKALASAIANQVLDISQGLTGGTFLAAPRRTGKSTFIRQDLVPELRSRDAEVIYVDLWADKTINPAILIANALRTALAQDDGAIAKFAKKAAGLSKLNIGAFGNGLSFDLSQLNMLKDATLADALRALSIATEKKIVLVIDEAQHAITTKEGMNALFSLKAARDSLNTDANLFGMQLVATGSNRDKLSSLVNGREQAFYGADMLNFPHLGKDYVEWAIRRSKLTINTDAAFEVFQKLGSRPEPFGKALRQCDVMAAGQQTGDHTRLFADLAQKEAEATKNNFLGSVDSLPPLQAAILREIAKSAKDGQRLSIYSVATQAKLKHRLDQQIGEGHNIQVDPSSIQNALESLREEQYLWKSDRGAYFIEDDQTSDWLNEDDHPDEVAVERDVPRG